MISIQNGKRLDLLSEPNGNVTHDIQYIFGTNNFVPHHEVFDDDAQKVIFRTRNESCLGELGTFVECL